MRQVLKVFNIMLFVLCYSIYKQGDSEFFQFTILLEVYGSTSYLNLSPNFVLYSLEKKTFDIMKNEYFICVVQMSHKCKNIIKGYTETLSLSDHMQIALLKSLLILFLTLQFFRAWLYIPCSLKVYVILIFCPDLPHQRWL